MRSLKPRYASTISSILALVGGAIFALSPTVDGWLTPPPSMAHVPPTTHISRLTHNGDGIYTLRIGGSVGVEYYLEATTSLMPPVVWAAVPGSTHLVTESHGQWEVVVTAEESGFLFFRSAVLTP